MALWTPQNILSVTWRERVMRDELRGDVNGYPQYTFDGWDVTGMGCALSGAF
jgi:hypothetical protein